MKTSKPRKIGIRLYPDDIQRLIEGLKVRCQDLEFYERRSNEKQALDIAIERFNCRELQRILESKLNNNENS